jgi:hypothetical protein
MKFFPFFGHFATKICQIWIKNVLKQQIFHGHLIDGWSLEKMDHYGPISQNREIFSRFQFLNLRGFLIDPNKKN